MSIQEMLDICQQIKPAQECQFKSAKFASPNVMTIYVTFSFTCNHLVSTGGALLEAYVLTNGSYKSRRLFKTQLKQITDDPLHNFDPEIGLLILENEKRGFFMFVLSCLLSRGQAGNGQMFYISLLINFRGLSRSGMKMLKALNCCVPITTFDDKLKAYVLVQEDKLRSNNYIRIIRTDAHENTK